MRFSSETTPRPVLPTEIWDQIIDGVAEIIDCWDSEMLQKRNDTLHACSLVARSWVPRSQTQLFRYVFLCSEVRVSRLVEALFHLPALGRHVDVLIIRPKIYQDSDKWIYHALSTLPLSLPCLRKLAFRDFSSLDPSSIVLTSHFSKVESLELVWLTEQSLTQVVQFTNQIQQLRKLSLRNCVWRLGSPCDSSKKHNLTTLSTAPMNTQCEEELLEWAIASGSTNALATFRGNSSGTDSTMDRVVQTCRSTLRELHLHLQLPLGVPRLSNHLALQRLALEGSHDFAMLALFLLPSFAPSSLVGIWVHCIDDTSGSFDGSSGFMLEAIDRALSSTSQFPDLKCVEFDVKSMKPPAYYHDAFQRVFPKSYERGVLWVRDDSDRSVLISPEGAPRYAGIPLEWEEFCE